MTTNLPCKPHGLPHTKTLGRHEDSRKRAESMLRDIAFVLKMTQKVRDEIETEQETEELVLA